jgi:hypothetical protein
MDLDLDVQSGVPGLSVLITLWRLPRPCRVLCDRAGTLTSYRASARGGESQNPYPFGFAQGRLCPRKKTQGQGWGHPRWESNEQFVA